MKCKKCEGILFKINTIPCCGDCSENSAWNEEENEYTFDLKIITDNKLVRDHVESEGECTYDTAYGSGCYMFTCSCCNSKTNLAVMEGC